MLYSCLLPLSPLSAIHSGFYLHHSDLKLLNTQEQERLECIRSFHLEQLHFPSSGTKYQLFGKALLCLEEKSLWQGHSSACWIRRAVVKHVLRKPLDYKLWVQNVKIAGKRALQFAACQYSLRKRGVLPGFGGTRTPRRLLSLGRITNSY